VRQLGAGGGYFCVATPAVDLEQADSQQPDDGSNGLLLLVGLLLVSAVVAVRA
jgi:hypothetical protein